MSPLSPRRPALRRLVSLTAAASAAALVLAGCSTRDAVSESSAASDSSFTPITITDQRGVEHTFTKPITSIVTTIIPAPSMITAIDGSYDKIKGVNESTTKRDAGTVFETMYPESVTNTVVSGSDFIPNVEEITKINPDVVIQWASQGDPAEFIEPIEKAGYEVIGLNYGTQEDLETWIKILGQLLGQEDRATELTSTLQDSIAKVEEYADTRDDSPRAIFLRGTGDGAYNAGMNNADKAYMPVWMTMNGSTNVAPDVEYSTTSNTNVEDIVKWDPEVIYVSGMTTMTVQDVLEDPALANVSAVKNKRVYAVPSGGFWWDPPSAESNLMFEWAAEVSRPDDQAFDLRADMKKSYEFLYGHELTDAEIDKILKLDQNADSAGYADAFSS